MNDPCNINVGILIHKRLKNFTTHTMSNYKSRLISPEPLQHRTNILMRIKKRKFLASLPRTIPETSQINHMHLKAIECMMNPRFKEADVLVLHEAMD
jgi:hypothetical protein